MKMKRKGSVKKKDIIAVMLVVMCFCLTIVSADAISGGYIFQELSAVFTSEKGVPVYYAVESGSYSDIDEAREASDLYRERGAGGYVINDGAYRLIVAVYSEKSDAEAVAQKLTGDGLSGTVYEIKGAKVNYGKYGDIGSEMETAVACGANVYSELYAISNELDKSEITESEAKIRIAVLSTEISTARDIFIGKTSDYAYDSTIIEIRAELASYAAALDNLNNELITRPSLLADIRYTYTMVVNSYCRMLRTLA